MVPIERVVSLLLHYVGKQINYLLLLPNNIHEKYCKICSQNRTETTLTSIKVERNRSPESKKRKTKSGWNCSQWLNCPLSIMDCKTFDSHTNLKFHRLQKSDIHKNDCGFKATNRQKAIIRINLLY